MVVFYLEALAAIAVSLSVLVAGAWAVQQCTGNSGWVDTIWTFSLGLGWRRKGAVAGRGRGGQLATMAGRGTGGAVVAAARLPYRRVVRLARQSRTSVFLPLPPQKGAI
jgi:steroid 5-alpha reductase family enzyme